jgi:hypothetical protein
MDKELASITLVKQLHIRMLTISRLHNSLSHVLLFDMQRTPEFQPQPMLETKIDFGCPVW